MSIQFQSRDRRSNYKSYYRKEEKNTTGRSGLLVGRWRLNPQVVGSRPASPFSFSHGDVPLHHSDLLFSISYSWERQRLTPTPLRPVDTYTLYFRREETKYNRSGWCTGRALALNTIGRGFWWLNEATPFNL